MSNQLHSELKKEFQLERMLFFSDAVFAIAITLLVIEIKIPEVHEMTDKAILQALGALIPKFIGFAVSFMLIGIYWNVHHRMFGLVINYTQKLVTLNLFFLFFIALMPFSAGFYSEYAGEPLYAHGVKVPLTFYVLNFFCIGLFNYFMWVYIANPKHKLIDPSVDRQMMRYSRARAIGVPCIFLAMIPVAYLVHPMVAIYMPMTIPIVVRIMRKRYLGKTDNETPLITK